MKPRAPFSISSLKLSIEAFKASFRSSSPVAGLIVGNLITSLMFCVNLVSNALVGYLASVFILLLFLILHYARFVFRASEVADNLAF